MLRIRDVYPGSEFFHPGSELSPSRIPTVSIPDPGSRIRIKEFKCYNPKKPKKWFISSRKNDPGCLSRIPDPDADFLPIPDPGSRGQKGTGSQIRIRNTESNLPIPVFRSILNAVLGRLKRSVLESLVKVLERGGQDCGPCCLIPPANLRKEKKNNIRQVKG